MGWCPRPGLGGDPGPRRAVLALRGAAGIGLACLRGMGELSEKEVGCHGLSV